MKRGLYIAAVCLFACCVATVAKAEEEHKQSGGAHTWVGTFEKSGDGKISFKSANGESHAIVAGEKASDETKAKLAAAEKELVGQGTFQVTGSIKKDGDVPTIHANTITKKGDGGGGGDHKEKKNGVNPSPE